MPGKIDIHTHILPPKLPNFKAKFGYGGFMGLEGGWMVRDDGTRFRKVEANLWDAKRRMAEMDETGVSMQVLSTVPVMFSYWARAKDGLELSRFLNDHIAEVVSSHQDRFSGLGTLPLQAPKLAVKEMERCRSMLGLAGVQIGTNVNGTNLDDPSLFPVFEAAAELGMAVFVHPWDMLAPERMKKYWMPWLVGMPAELTLAISSLMFSGLFARLPKLRIAFAHGGGCFGASFGRLEQGFKARPDLCAVDNPASPRAVLGRFYVDSLVHDAKLLSYLIDLFGADRIALGTDYPFPLGETEPGRLISKMTLNPQVKERLLSGTALEWLGKTQGVLHAH
jgi:aminocarboxymuconate-semialdehyde decarboxylase